MVRFSSIEESNILFLNLWSIFISVLPYRIENFEHFGSQRFQVRCVFSQGVQIVLTVMETSARESSEVGWGRAKEMGDWGDCFTNCSALLWAIHEDQWSELFIRVLRILWSNIYSRVLQGGIASRCQSCEQAAEISVQISDGVPAFESKRNGPSVSQSA